jgi:hypothetical protein
MAFFCKFRKQQTARLVNAPISDKWLLAKPQCIHRIRELPPDGYSVR